MCAYAYDPEGEGDEACSAGLDIGYGGDFSVEVEGAQVRPEAEREGGVLAPISSNRMALDAVRSLDLHGELEDVLDVITSLDAFESLLTKPTGGRMARGTSRHMRQHADKLLEWEVVEPMQGDPQMTMPAFTVAKKAGDLRLVVDARKLNAAMRRPPEMRLPRIRDVIDAVLNADAAVIADGVSFFYQIPLAKPIRKYFGMRLGDGRGGTLDLWLKVLCMGWSWSPSIAQRISRVLAGPGNVAWVDNYIILGGSEEEAARRYTEFKQRCAYARVELHEEAEGQPQRQFAAFGLEFDLRGPTKRFRSSEKWVAQLLEAVHVQNVLSGEATPRAFFKVTGAIVWWTYTRSRHLCYSPNLIGAIRSIARHVSTNNNAWDEPTRMQPSAVWDARVCLQAIAENRWVDREAPYDEECTVWTDASSRAWAALAETGEVAQGAFGAGEASAHIYIKEMWAAALGVRLASRLGRRRCKLRLKVDNLPVVRSILKGHSGNYVANRCLQVLFDVAAAAQLQVLPEWVPTHEQKADPFTRGARGEVVIDL